MPDGTGDGDRRDVGPAPLACLLSALVRLGVETLRFLVVRERQATEANGLLSF